MSVLAKFVAKVVGIVLIGGLLGATLVRFAPGFGVDEEELDTRLNSQSIQNLRAQQESVSVGRFYADYLARLLHGDLGVSRTLQQPVTRLLADRFPETLKSVALGLTLGWSLGLSFAIATVLTRAWVVDALASFLAALLLCLPAAVLAILFVLARIPAQFLLGLVVFPKVFRYSRNLLARSASLPHVLTARAKGLATGRILLWHILPTAAPQLLALAGVSISLAFTAAIPVEALCDLPGIGQLAWKAALGRDITLLINLTMIVTLVTLLANSMSEWAGRAFGARAA
ncbi:MAG TPA: ABC transporter permease [Terriglobales bacterium]|jgi:peptide/nickel transport system permease protein